MFICRPGSRLTRLSSLSARNLLAASAISLITRSAAVLAALRRLGRVMDRRPLHRARDAQPHRGAEGAIVDHAEQGDAHLDTAVRRRAKARTGQVSTARCAIRPRRSGIGPGVMIG